MKTKFRYKILLIVLFVAAAICTTSALSNTLSTEQMLATTGGECGATCDPCGCILPFISCRYVSQKGRCEEFVGGGVGARCKDSEEGECEDSMQYPCGCLGRWCDLDEGSCTESEADCSCHEGVLDPIPGCNY